MAENVKMVRRRSLEAPVLPASLRLRGDELTVSLSGKRAVLPVLELSEGRLSTIRTLIGSKKPHVIIAPHLSAAAKESIEGARWGWVETSGNAHIATNGIFVHIERPPAQTSRSAGSLLIPPQGERIVRHLLDAYPRGQRFTDLARATQLDKGYTSRILAKLRETGLVTYERNKPVEVAYPAELFELWQTGPVRTIESPWFVAAPSDLRRLAARIREGAGRGRIAFTGVFAANLLVEHIEPERIDCYVDDLRTATRIAERLGGSRVKSGVNLLFLVHRDPGILSIGIRSVDDIPVASPTQVYRDALDRGRGREREAANMLRRELLTW